MDLRIGWAAPNHLVVGGDIDLYSSSQLSRAIDTVHQDRQVIIDMADVEFLDSFGLRVLVDTWSRGAGHHSGLQVRNPSLVVRRVLELSGLDDQFDINES
jgi:anti-anti-sigma factor